MPATAGRVRMPANNRVHSSAALQTHGIWQSAIGYDPYAPNKEDNKKSAQPQTSNAEPEGENAYASFQGLLALARITGSNADEARGSCKKCGRVGHLTFQCRNFLSIKEDKEKDPEAIQAAVMSGLEKTAKYGKKLTKSKSSRKKKDDDSDDTSEDDERKKRGRSKKRSVNRRKEKKRRKDESSDDDVDRRSRRRKSRKEKRRRRSHRDLDDSDSSEDLGRRKRRSNRRSDSDSDGSSSDDSRVGRDKRRSDRRSRK
ncbi:putative transcription factor interactor and regulator CCHC(Zn) family [Helianthus annuus]|nr:putative transcription factor interactor and regulator CCHC(Zn) family [Helianthus annuus]